MFYECCPQDWGHTINLQRAAICLSNTVGYLWIFMGPLWPITQLNETVLPLEALPGDKRKLVEALYSHD